MNVSAKINFLLKFISIYIYICIYIYIRVCVCVCVCVCVWVWRQECLRYMCSIKHDKVQCGNRDSSFERAFCLRPDLFWDIMLSVGWQILTDVSRLQDLAYTTAKAWNTAVSCLPFQCSICKQYSFLRNVYAYLKATFCVMSHETLI